MRQNPLMLVAENLFVSTVLFFGCEKKFRKGSSYEKENSSSRFFTANLLAS
jgi:hypothetical protein